MKFIEHNPMNIESMLGVGFRRKHLIKAVSRCIHDTFLRGQDFHSFIQGRTHSHHVSGNIKNDSRLLSVGGTAVNLGSFLSVTTGEEQSNRRRQF